MKFLFIIPARGGSKGIPGKNIKNLADKPLLHYSIELARQFSADADICLSTDDDEIAACAEEVNLTTPFRRPAKMATDNSGSYEYIMHAIEHYEKKGRHYDAIVLLQPTSPLRRADQLKSMLQDFSTDMDMMVSVQEARHNPVCVSFIEDEKGCLSRLFKEESTLRQEVPVVYEYNGAFYIMNVQSLKQGSYNEFKDIRKFVMDEVSSLDIDTPLDWGFAEFIMQRSHLLNGQ
ncbi:MAG: acylneuraminate cytidylyltransferase family protein [Lentisphaeraceae bacterium]|nr:acylneuraminate cytidylyltransferase family protein [Lentisphaeraceae bacterium]